MNEQMTLIEITRVSEDQRLSFIENRFGIHFPLAIEPTVYAFADRLCADYAGGYWNFYTLSNGGFYMSPEGKETFHLCCENTFEGDLSADAFGLTCCLYAFSHLSFSDSEDLGQLCGQHYHWLREAVMDHPESGKILAACD